MRLHHAQRSGMQTRARNTRRANALARHRHRPMFEPLEDRPLLSGGPDAGTMKMLFDKVQSVDTTLATQLVKLGKLPIVGTAIQSGVSGLNDISDLVAKVEKQFEAVPLIQDPGDPEFYLPIKFDNEPLIQGQAFQLQLGSLLNIQGAIDRGCQHRHAPRFVKPSGNSFSLDTGTDIAAFAAKNPGVFVSSVATSFGGTAGLSALPHDPIAIRFVAALSPDFSADFNLGNGLPGRGPRHGHLGVSPTTGLGNLDLAGTMGFGIDEDTGITSPSFAGKFDLGLGLTLSFLGSNANTSSPFNLQFMSDLMLHWTFGNTTSGFDNAGGISGSFTNLQINLGSLFGASAAIGGQDGIISQLKKYTSAPTAAGYALNSEISDYQPIRDPRDILGRSQGGQRASQHGAFG